MRLGLDQNKVDTLTMNRMLQHRPRCTFIVLSKNVKRVFNIHTQEKLKKMAKTWIIMTIQSLWFISRIKWTLVLLDTDLYMPKWSWIYLTSFYLDWAESCVWPKSCIPTLEQLGPIQGPMWGSKTSPYSFMSVFRCCRRLGDLLNRFWKIKTTICGKPQHLKIGGAVHPKNEFRIFSCKGMFSVCSFCCFNHLLRDWTLKIGKSIARVLKNMYFLSFLETTIFWKK